MHFDHTMIWFLMNDDGWFGKSHEVIFPDEWWQSMIKQKTSPSLGSKPQRRPSRLSTVMCWWTLICLFPAEEDADEEVMRTVEEGLEESERPRKSWKKIDGTKKTGPWWFLPKVTFLFGRFLYVTISGVKSDVIKTIPWSKGERSWWKRFGMVLEVSKASCVAGLLESFESSRFWDD